MQLNIIALDKRSIALGIDKAIDIQSSGIEITPRIGVDGATEAQFLYHFVRRKPVLF